MSAIVVGSRIELVDETAGEPATALGSGSPSAAVVHVHVLADDGAKERSRLLATRARER